MENAKQQTLFDTIIQLFLSTDTPDIGNNIGLHASWVQLLQNLYEVISIR